MSGDRSTDGAQGAFRPSLDDAVGIPDHVVFREFAQETVLLDVERGQYFGLNPTAGRMLVALQETTTLRAAADRLETEFPDADGAISQDLQEFCVALSSRGLLEAKGGEKVE